MFETMFKEAMIERTCAMQERSAQSKISFSKELFVEDFKGMRVFLQESRYVPVPGGTECMLCTVTIARNNPVLQELGEENRKVILVGAAFMALPHVKKLILLRAEQLRQVQSLTADLARPEGVASTTLDREVACRQALAWEFKPKLIERTLRGRDGVVVKSSTRVAQGIYANSDDHYKASKHPFGQGGRAYRCYPVDEAPKSWGHPLTDEEFQAELNRLREFGEEAREEAECTAETLSHMTREPEPPLGSEA